MPTLLDAHLKTETRAKMVADYLKTPLQKMLDEQIPRLSEQEAKNRKKWIKDAMEQRKKYGTPPAETLETIIQDWEQMRPRMYERLKQEDRVVATAEALYHPWSRRMIQLKELWVTDKIKDPDEYLHEKEMLSRMILRYPETDSDEGDMRSEGSEQ